MTIWIYSGDRPSNGAKELAKQPGFKRCRTGKFLKKNDIVVNWGASSTLDFHEWGLKVLNPAEATRRACNKLHAFQTMEGVQCVPWTTDPEVADDWNSVVVARQTLTGHSGKG